MQRMIRRALPESEKLGPDWNLLLRGKASTGNLLQMDDALTIIRKSQLEAQRSPYYRQARPAFHPVVTPIIPGGSTTGMLGYGPRIRATSIYPRKALQYRGLLL